MQNAKCKMQNAKCKTDAAEREQRANLFALCRAARRKSLRSRINAELKNNSQFSILNSQLKKPMATAAIKPRAETACRLCRGEAVKTKCQWLMAKSKKVII